MMSGVSGRLSRRLAAFSLACVPIPLRSILVRGARYGLASHPAQPAPVSNRPIRPAPAVAHGRLSASDVWANPMVSAADLRRLSLVHSCVPGASRHEASSATST